MCRKFGETLTTIPGGAGFNLTVTNYEKNTFLFIVPGLAVWSNGS